MSNTTNASGTTAHYGLSQWAADDRILLEDFNRDNAAIDAALHQQKTAAESAIAALEQSVCITRLASQTPASAVSSISISLSGVDLSQYQELRLVFSPLLCPSYTKVMIRFNGDSGSNYLNYSDSSAADHIRLDGNAFDLLAGELILWNGGSCVLGKYAGSTYKSSLSSTTGMGRCWKGGGLSALTSIQIIPVSGSIGAGTRVVLYGLKK